MPAPTNLVVFLDQSTQNTLDAGLAVTIYPFGSPQISGNIVATGTLNVNGACLLALAPSTWYTAVFVGTGAPTYPYNFQLGDGTSIVGPFAQVSDQVNASKGVLGIANGSNAVKTLIQWLEVTVTTGDDGTGSVAVTFDEPFPNNVLRVISGIDDGSSFSGYAAQARALARTANGFTAYVFSGPPNATVNAEFIVIGY